MDAACHGMLHESDEISKIEDLLEQIGGRHAGIFFFFKFKRNRFQVQGVFIILCVESPSLTYLL